MEAEKYLEEQKAEYLRAKRELELDMLEDSGLDDDCSENEEDEAGDKGEKKERKVRINERTSWSFHLF